MIWCAQAIQGKSGNQEEIEAAPRHRLLLSQFSFFQHWQENMESCRFSEKASSRWKIKYQQRSREKKSFPKRGEHWRSGSRQRKELSLKVQKRFWGQWTGGEQFCKSFVCTAGVQTSQPTIQQCTALISRQLLHCSLNCDAFVETPRWLESMQTWRGGSDWYWRRSERWKWGCDKEKRKNRVRKSYVEKVIFLINPYLKLETVRKSHLCSNCPETRKRENI